jgi:hypothetical protein
MNAGRLRNEAGLKSGLEREKRAKDAMRSGRQAIGQTTGIFVLAKRSPAFAVGRRPQRQTIAPQANGEKTLFPFLEA